MRHAQPIQTAIEYWAAKFRIPIWREILSEIFQQNHLNNLIKIN